MKRRKAGKGQRQEGTRLGQETTNLEPKTMSIFYRSCSDGYERKVSFVCIISRHTHTHTHSDAEREICSLILFVFWGEMIETPFQHS